jgi:hypothetical protein
VDDEVVGKIIVDLKVDPVEAVKDDEGEPAEALVAIHQSVIAHERLQQCCGLVVEVAVGIPAEDRARRSRRRGVHQPNIPDRPDAEVLDEGEEVFESEVFGHRPSRSIRTP